MAVIDSGGVQFAPMAPQINYGALAGVRPLSFGQNPLQFQPMPAFDVGQTKPYIAEGISKAFEGIAGGITAQYKRQDALKELAIKQAQFDRQQTAKEADDKLRRESEKIRAEAEKLRATASEIKERGKAVGVTDTSLSDYGDDSGGTKSGGVLSGTTAEPSRKLAEIDFGSGADDSGEPEPRGRVEARRLGEERLRRAEASGQLPQPGLELVAEGLSAPQVSLLGDMEKPAPIQLGVDYLPAPQFGLGLASAPSRPQPALQSPAFASLKPPGAQQEPLPLPQGPSSVTVGQLVGAPEPAGGAPVDFSNLFGAPVPQAKREPLTPIAIVPNQPGGALATAQLAEKIMKQFNASGHPTLRADGIEYDKNGYKIKYTNIEQEKQKAEDRERKMSSAEREKIARVTLREGSAITSHPSFKNYENPNGLRPQMRAFTAAYQSVNEHPEAAGAADVDLLNSYVRATSGGKVTENEVHLMIKANDYISRLKLIPGKAATGQLLTQNQRDQMMRTMAHMNNMAASSANDVLSTARERMVQGGQKNEIHLPKPYVNNLILKGDAVSQIKKIGSEIKTLESRRIAAIKANSPEKAKQIEEKMKEMLHEQESLSSRLEKEEFTSSPLLGGVDFETKSQGYVGGTGGYLFNMPSASEGDGGAASE
jgi:hypothetical protein